MPISLYRELRQKEVKSFPEVFGAKSIQSECIMVITIEIPLNDSTGLEG